MIILALVLSSTPITPDIYEKLNYSHLPGAWADVRQADLRVATIVYRLSVGNAALCGSRWASTGIVFHSLDQYPAHQSGAARREFGFEAPLSVEDVIAGSPAELAGLRSGDGILQIAQAAMPGDMPKTEPGMLLKDYATQVAGSLPAGMPMDVLTISNGDQNVRRVVPQEACKVFTDVVTDNGIGAISDDKTIQISFEYVQRFDDNGLAVIIAHELAHIILKNSCASKAYDGVNLARSVHLRSVKRRQAEDNADDLSVWILSNSGYDPLISANFWRSAGRKISGGIFRSSAYRSAQDRAARMLDEISAFNRVRGQEALHLSAKFGLKYCISR